MVNKKLLKEQVRRNEVYRAVKYVPEKILNVFSWGARKIPGMVKTPPIARFVEYDKNGNKIKGGRVKDCTYEDIIGMVISKISDQKDPQGQPLFDSKYLTSSEDGNSFKKIRELIDSEISGELTKKVEKDAIQPNKYVDGSKEIVLTHNGKRINYEEQIKHERDRVANQLNIYIKKYLEKKPKDRQFIENEDKEVLDKYLKYHMERDEIAYKKVVMVAAPVAAVGSLFILGSLALSGLAGGIVLGIGILLIAAAVLAVLGTVLYKNKEMSINDMTQTIKDEHEKRFEEMKQEEKEKKEEKKRGKFTAGEIPDGEIPPSVSNPDSENASLVDSSKKLSSSRVISSSDDTMSRSNQSGPPGGSYADTLKQRTQSRSNITPGPGGGS